MPLEYDGTFGYYDGEDLRLSNEAANVADESFPAVRRVVATVFGDIGMNDNDVDPEEIEDEEELDTLAAEGVDDEYVDAAVNFVEEVRERDRTLSGAPVPPIYDAVPDERNDDADSFPYSGMARPDAFDGERDQLRIGMLFKNKEALQLAVKEWSIRNNRQFVVRHGATNKTLWEVYCMTKEETGCAWRLRGTLKRKHGLWEIVRLTPTHTCMFSTIQSDHANLTSSLISNAITHLVAKDPSISINMIVAEVAEKYKITIQYAKAWYAKQIAVAHVFGDWKESYEKLPRLLLALKQTNPGTVVSIFKSVVDPVTNESQLLRLFWAFGPSIQGFQGCRPVMSIDATHLYGKYKGKLLIAMGVDGNGQIFPVGFGLVREESKSDWGWFFMKLRKAIGPRPNLCLISDRHLGITTAVNDPANGWAPPFATHRFCLRHIRSNFMGKFHNAALKNMVWNIGSEIEKYKFEEGMAELEKLHTAAWQWCKEIPKEQWSLAYDEGHRYGCMTTNLVECFNGVLIAGRNLPVCAMVMLIFHRLVLYFVHKRNNWNRMRIINTHSITDKGVELLEHAREHARHLHIGFVHCRQKGLGSIISNIGNSHPVDLSKNYCGCGGWYQYKVPCGHAIRMCMALHIDHKEFVHPLYKLEAYQLTYEPQFYPLLHSAYWPPYDGPTVVPPSGTLRGIGRPISTRFRNEMDARAAVQRKHCSRCRQPGHSIRTCKAPAGESSSGASTSRPATNV